MTSLELIFYIFSSILLLSSLGVVLFKNPVYSALSLISCFITSAFLWLLLEAEFLALVLVLVYVGAVMVLFLFVIMMLNIELEVETSQFNKIAPLGLIVGLIIVGELMTLIWLRSDQFLVTSSAVSSFDKEASNSVLLGTKLFTDYIYAFEISGFILLLAIIVSISLTLRRRKGLKRQIVSKQVDIDPATRVKLVDMESEVNK